MADCRTLDSKLVLSLFTDSLVEVFPQTPAPASPPGYVQDKSTACSFYTCFQILDTKLEFLHRHLSRGQRNKLKDKLAPEPPNGRMCFTLKLSCSWQFIANHTY